MINYEHKIIDCKKYRDENESEIKKIISSNSLELKLVIVQLGNDASSNSYINSKLKACDRCGIKTELLKFEINTTQDELLRIIEKLNKDSSVTGILVQFPLPTHINPKIISDSILHTKDVDGFSMINKGKLYSGDDCLVPCTAQGVVDILKYNNVEISGKKVVIINRSYLVGKPLIHLFLNNNATVTVCHSYTKNPEIISSNADIIVVGVGTPKFLNSSHVKQGAIILDVGINHLNGKLCGDVDFEDCIEKCSMITKVPGGVGILTVTNLLKNILKASTLN